MTKRKPIALLMAIIMTVLLLPIGAFAADPYDYTSSPVSDYAGNQGTDNTLTLYPYGGITIKTLGETSTDYYNKITTFIDSTKTVYFDFQMSAGMNTFKESDFKTNNMPLIKIETADHSTVVANYNNGSGALKYIGFTKGTGTTYPTSASYIRIGVDANVLSKNTVYSLVFDKNIQGNNASKILNKNVIFLFKTVSFSVNVNGKTITDNEVTSLTPQSITTSGVKKSGGAADDHTYVGYKLSEILNLAGVTVNTTDKGITAVSPDRTSDYTTPDEINANDTLLAITRDGINTNGLILAPCANKQASFYAKQVVSINEILPDFTVTIGSKTIANADVKKLDVVSYSSTSTNSKGVTSTATYKGYKLSDVLTLAGIDYTNGITVTATDGYANTYSKDVVSNPKTLLAITKGGATTDGPFIAPCDSAVGKDYAKKVSTIAATPVPAAAPVTTTAPVTTKSNNPKTDDNSYIYSSVIIIVASSFMIALVEFKRKKVEE